MARRSTPEQAEAESARVAEHLRAVLEREAVTIRSVEEALGWGGGMLNRILSGATDLKVAHVLAVLGVIDYPAARFFAEAFGESKGARGGEGGGGGEIVPGLSRDMLRREIAAALQRMPKPPRKPKGGAQKRKRDRLHRSVIGG